MALVFKSAHRRAFWTAFAFSVATEYVVFVAIFLFSFDWNPYSWLWGMLAVIALQLALALYGLFSFARRALWYFWIERDDRAQLIADEFNRLNFPRPDGFYNDADQYLTEVALSPATSPEAALFAGTLIGMLNAHRSNGPRSEALSLAMSVERAMLKMLPWSALP